ncbi:hypothetical protein [Bartonella raoultii]|uniref:Uncharacterized protein n=1 Tax=Bartonella raoultii TaxID=1457020 RepID=A0ABS7I5T1_9HYPH|nr:hypothetical protein [Bartonella raoultii]MBX4335755.1 hypothetical protein [Bartonella raoultii]
MKEKNMIDFKNYSSIYCYSYAKEMFKKIFHFLKEPAFIGSLNGSLSGAIAAILSAYGYIALPGFGPIIAKGIIIALSTGTIIGAIIGTCIGILVGIFCTFIENLYTLR